MKTITFYIACAFLGAAIGSVLSAAIDMSAYINSFGMDQTVERLIISKVVICAFGCIGAFLFGLISTSIPER